MATAPKPRLVPFPLGLLALAALAVLLPTGPRAQDPDKAAAPDSAPRNLLANPAVDGRATGWSNTGGTKFGFDGEAGATGPGSLSIRGERDGDQLPHNWHQRIDAPAGAPYRLALGARVKAEDLRSGAEACVMVQCWAGADRAVGYAWCDKVTADTAGAWRAIACVFEVPEGTTHVRVLAYLTGRGKVWFDDFSLAKTEAPLTPAPGAFAPARDDALSALVRRCADDLPWQFDAARARQAARAAHRPLLVYVRCTDDEQGLPDAERSIDARELRLLDDGYRKDMLFRAGPLSDPDVAELVRRRCVPLCVTYQLATHGFGRSGGPWHAVPGGSTAGLHVDREVGATRPGSLEIVRAAPGGPGVPAWYQVVVVPRGQRGALRLEASVRTDGIADGSGAAIRLLFNRRGGAAMHESSERVRSEGDWTVLALELPIPDGLANAVIQLELHGAGRAFFDDVVLRVTAPGIAGSDTGENLVVDGPIDRGTSPDPLATFGLSSADVVTPALLLCTADADAAGERVVKLHRIGTLSAPLVDRWLRDALAALAPAGDPPAGKERAALGDLYAAGRLDAVLARTADLAADDGDALLWRARALTRLGRIDEALALLGDRQDLGAHAERGLCLMRRGAFDLALPELDAAASDSQRGGEARYLAALCRHRLGRHGEANARWRDLVADAGDSRFGRKAAANLLPAGPRLWLSTSERARPLDVAAGDATEVGGAFDPVQSVRALLELQEADGSFGSHQGAVGHGPWSAALTALADGALAAWRADLPPPLQARIDRAHDTALAFLDRWLDTDTGSTDAFNAPYVLMHLVDLGESDRARAARAVARVAKIQYPDGNWSVYHAGRPASFNTALCVMALAQAEAAGVPLPEDALQRGTKALGAMRRTAGLYPYSTATGHEWMTTEHGSIARDALCEQALILVGEGSVDRLAAALRRYLDHHEELRVPTKKLYDYFNARGHGGYYFFFAHHNAVRAAALVDEPLREQVLRAARAAVRACREGDGTFMDHYMLGRAYGTAMALSILR